MSARALLLLLALAACGPHEPEPPTPGTLTVTFNNRAGSVDQLTLTKVTMRLERVSVFGNAPRPPPPVDIDFDVLAAGGASHVFGMLTPGLYSRVQLSFDDVDVEGTWRGTPFQVQIIIMSMGPGPPPVDLRSPTGQDLEAGQDVTLAVTVDPTSWFAGNLLDSATVASGQILCDSQHNQDLLMTIGPRIAQSFQLQ